MPDSSYVVPDHLTEEQIADAKRALEDLAKALARVSARVCHEMGIQFDLDDPEIAREVLKMTFEAMFLSAPKTPPRTAKARRRTCAKQPAQARRDELGKARQRAAQGHQFCLQSIPAAHS
jgi:hypothetical protein